MTAESYSAALLINPAAVRDDQALPLLLGLAVDTLTATVQRVIPGGRMTWTGLTPARVAMPEFPDMYAVLCEIQR